MKISASITKYLLASLTFHQRVADLRLAVAPNTGDKSVRLEFSQPWSQQGIDEYLNSEYCSGFDDHSKAPCSTSSTVDKAETTSSFAMPSEGSAQKGSVTILMSNMSEKNIP